MEITMRNKKKWAGLLLCLPIVGHAMQISGIRGDRYCEVVLSEGWFNFAVYNSMGLNHCPQGKWDKLTTSMIKKETGASKVMLNGPRYWTMDGAKNTRMVKPEEKTFGGIGMRKLAYVHLGLFDVLGGGRPYKDHQVDRNTVFTYQEGKPVYELIDPKGQVYVMQSYSVEKAKQTPRSLSKLGAQLKLPHGWTYKTGILKKTTYLQTQNKKAVVIQDNLMNTYQLASHDFLK
jgi:hypothetical protein